jgi:hypothetical protein
LVVEGPALFMVGGRMGYQTKSLDHKNSFFGDPKMTASVSQFEHHVTVPPDSDLLFPVAVLMGGL